MPLPAVYDESTLADFMVTVLGTSGEALGWDAGSDQIVEAVAEVDGLLTGGLAGATGSPSVLKVRVLARWQAWKAARSAAAPQYDISDDRSPMLRSQWYDHLDHELYDASLAASVYSEGASALNGGVVSVVQFADPSDPYGWNVVKNEFG